GATPGVRELATSFAQASGHKVAVIQEAGAALERRLNSPAPGDLLTANPEPFDDLVKKGKVVAGTVTPFVLAGLGVSVRAGAPNPDISTVAAYKAALIAAKSIGYSYGCSGTHVAEGIEKLGLTEQLKAKTVRTGTGAAGGPVTDHLARGEFEIGIQQTNIMVGMAGADYVGAGPGGLNKLCQSNVALLSGFQEPDASRALIGFMISPAGARLPRQPHT